MTCKNCLEQYVGLATNFKNRFRIHKTISTLTKIDLGRQSILILCVRIITIFFSFCLLKLLNKFVVIPQTLKIFYGARKKIGEASFLPRLMT